MLVFVAGLNLIKGGVTYIVLGGIFLAVIMGTWAGAVAGNKGRSMQWWFLLGFFVPVIGLVAAYLIKPIKQGGKEEKE